MNMTVVHFSDWHGSWRQLPYADVYVCTGDMLPNLVLPAGDEGRRVRAPFESDVQKLWLEGLSRWTHGFRAECFPENPNAPVVCVRGNHDFTSLAPLFGGEVYELTGDTNAVELDGIVFAGVRGVPARRLEWSDEIQPATMRKKLLALPHRVDILLTHTPAHGHLDYPKDGFHGGCTVLRDWLNERADDPDGETPLVHCFGHAHFTEGPPELRTVGRSKAQVLFSNAATRYNAFQL